MRNATVLAALLLLTPAVSQAKTLEEMLVAKGVITKGEAASASDSAASKLYWNQGTRVEFPDNGFTTSVATMLQTRYAFTDRDEDAGLSNTSSFDVNRARLIISGTALNREFSYMLSTDFIQAPDTDANSGQQAPAVRDAYIDWKPCNDNMGIRMGAFKTAVSRQFSKDGITRWYYKGNLDMPVTFNYGYISDLNYQKACKLWTICEKHGEESPRAAALQFVLAHPQVSGVIIGASSPEHLVELKSSIERAVAPRLFDELGAEGIVRY